MKVKDIVLYIFLLILVYLFATRGAAINTLIATLGNFSLKSVAVLQGRDNISGVTG